MNYFLLAVRYICCFFFFFSSRRRHTRSLRDWSSDVCSSDLPAHTVAFAARHLMSRVRGTFSEVNGEIVTGPDPTFCSATAAVALSSVSTGNEMRDNHLRSADFFDIEHSPTMTFASTGLRQENGAWV